jgi:hypothetical protein
MTESANQKEDALEGFQYPVCQSGREIVSALLDAGSGLKQNRIEGKNGPAGPEESPDHAQPPSGRS